MQEHTRDDLVALGPDRYLADGFRDASGAPRPELRGLYATAACTRLLDAELAPQELGFTLEALRLLLPQHEERDPAVRLLAAMREALETVARSIQQPNNRGLVAWLDGCIRHVRTEADIAAFLDHMTAVTRQYAMLAALS